MLCTHSAIAYGDALAILAAGKKSKSGDHRDAGAFLASVVAVDTNQAKAALRAFQSILNRKVSYADEIVRESDAAALLERLHRFAGLREARCAAETWLQGWWTGPTAPRVWVPIQVAREYENGSSTLPAGAPQRLR